MSRFARPLSQPPLAKVDMPNDLYDVTSILVYVEADGLRGLRWIAYVNITSNGLPIQVVLRGLNVDRWESSHLLPSDTEFSKQASYLIEHRQSAI